MAATAIFVVEDDAQDDPDHVDAHRSLCYVVSPYVKARSVDRILHNTDGVLRSTELLLGLPVLSQHDKVAQPVTFADTAANDAPFQATLPDASIIGEHNPSLGRVEVAPGPPP